MHHVIVAQRATELVGISYVRYSCNINDFKRYRFQL